MICLDCQAAHRRARRRGEDCTYRGRYTLRRHPDSYVRDSSIACLRCKSLNVRSDEVNRQAEQDRAEHCYCHGVPFKHKVGSIMGCSKHPLDLEQWTDDDHQNYQAMLDTIRGG